MAIERTLSIIKPDGRQKAMSSARSSAIFEERGLAYRRR